MGSNANLHPQVPDVPFSDGQLLTATTAYMMAQGPFFDDLPNLLCHRDRLKDEELSNAPTAIKARVNALESGLRVTVQSGRTIQWAQGSVLDSTGAIVAVAAGTMTLPANSTVFIWWQEGAGVTSGPVAPNLRGLMARAVVGASTISTLEDLRTPAALRVQPTANTIRCLGGQSVTDKTCTQGEVFGQGVYYFRSFTVPAGVTINITTNTEIHCSGTFRVEGSIVLAAAIPGAVRQPMALSALGTVGNMPGMGLGGTGIAYGYGGHRYGSGGQSGLGMTNSGNSWAVLPAAGLGAVGLIVNAAGPVEVVSGGSIIANGSNAEWATNVNSANPNTCIVSGSGGGSGGLIWLSSRLSVTVAGTLSYRGGDGGSAYRSSGMPTTFAALGGYSGSAGVCVLQAPTVNTTGSTLQNTAGGFGPHVGLNGSNQITSPTALLGGGNGGGFATNSGFATTAGSPTVTVTNNVPSPGLLFIFNNIPTG